MLNKDNDCEKAGKMHPMETMAFMGAMLLLFIVSLSALSAFSRVLAQTGKSAQARRSWEGGCLLWLVFVWTLVLLVWRMS
jgi:hypothetical protein